MKKNIWILLIGIGFLMGCASPSLSFVEKKGAYQTTSLSSTAVIDLNPVGEEDIRSYYSSLNSLSAEERQGTNLLKNLKPILKEGQKYFSYDTSGDNIWKAYEITDRDWAKSPANEILTYDPETNTLKGYTYGKDKPYLHVLYIDRSVDNQVIADSAAHNTKSWDYNREHIWMKSFGMKESGSPVSAGPGARGDLHHLWPSAGIINTDTHKDKVYGYVVEENRTNKDPDNNPQYNGNYSGISKTLGGSKVVFEPQDSDKGDIARALFYMAARYNACAGPDSDEFSINNPNLYLSDVVDPEGGISTGTNAFCVGILHDLLEWNRLDPPDEFEIRRNDLVYRNYTNNRNPFIDFPSWAEDIWGKPVEGTLEYESSGKSASPSSDPIGTFQVPTITSSETSVTVKIGDSSTISLENNASATMELSLKDPQIATISASSIDASGSLTITGTQIGSTDLDVSMTVNGARYSLTIPVTVQSSMSGNCDVLTKAKVLPNQASSNNYLEWTYTGDSMGISYAGNSATSYDSIQIRSNKSNSGVVMTASSRSISKVDLEFQTNTTAGRTVQIYGKSNPYSSPGDLFDAEKQGTLLGEATYQTDQAIQTITFATPYPYVGIRSSSGAAYLSSISFHGAEEGQTPSLRATCSKVFGPGEEIRKSDISVVDSSGNAIEDFEFKGDGYAFTYSDTLENGLKGTKTFSVTYGESSTEVEVFTARPVYQAPESSTKSIDSSLLIAGKVPSGTSSAAASGTFTDEDGVSYSYTNAYLYTPTSETYQGTTFLSFGKSNIGEIHNTSPLPLPIASLSARYQSGSPEGNLRVSEDGNVYVLLKDADLSATSYRYFRFDYEGITLPSYTNILSIEIGMQEKESAQSLVNFLMQEDAEGQCENKLATAEAIYASLSSSEQSLFDTDASYCFTCARARLYAWRAAPKGGGSAIQMTNPIAKKESFSIVVVSCVFFLSAGAYALLRRTRRNEE
ncbi:MAG: endonuclease [Candidatus Enteromonas sp.]|nr:endonuclease [Candidatus Enteromonas sp.]